MWERNTHSAAAARSGMLAGMLALVVLPALGGAAAGCSSAPPGDAGSGGTPNAVQAGPASADASTDASTPAPLPDLGPAQMRVTFLGTGAPRPSLLRYGPTTLVEAGDHVILVDPSWGLTRRIMEAGSFDLLTRIDHVIVSHLHYDHTIGLPELWLGGWLFGRAEPLRVQGPVGTSAMLRNFQDAYRWDVDFRLTVGVPDGGQRIVAEDVSPGVIFEADGLRITAFEVPHKPIDIETREPLHFDGQTLGFRLDYAGRTLVLSSDTRESQEVAEQARGADVLVHEVQVPSPGATEEAKLANVSLSVHTDPEGAARVFREARPRMAVYSHIIPPDVTADELAAATDYDGAMTVAHDLMMITIGDEIVVADRPRAAGTTFESSSVLP